MNRYLLVFFTSEFQKTPVSGPFGLFCGVGAALEFAEGHYKTSKAERGGARVDGFYTIPAENYTFGPDGKAMIKHLS